MSSSPLYDSGRGGCHHRVGGGWGTRAKRSSAGIIDSHALMLAYQGEAESAGAFVALRSPVLSGGVCGDGFEIAVGGAEPATIRCRLLVNAAGLFAPALARTMDGIPPETIP